MSRMTVRGSVCVMALAFSIFCSIGGPIIIVGTENLHFFLSKIMQACHHVDMVYSRTCPLPVTVSVVHCYLN